MEWMLLAALGIMWVAFLVPRGRKRSEARSVIDFEHRMELLANAEVHGTTGRWIVTPRKGVRFLGPDDRRRARARQRRRKVFVVLLDAILTSLMGVAPPLRAMWYVAAGLGAFLFLYVWVLLSLKGRSNPRRRPVPAKANGASGRPVGVPSLAVPNAATAPPPAFHDLDIFGDDEPVHVVVRTASAGV